MSNLQIQKTPSVNTANNIAIPVGRNFINNFDDYQYQGMQITSECKDKDYKNFQKAEVILAFAGFSLNNSNALKNYNKIAKQSGYDGVNLIHRHDI